MNSNRNSATATAVMPALDCDMLRGYSSGHILDISYPAVFAVVVVVVVML